MATPARSPRGREIINFREELPNPRGGGAFSSACAAIAKPRAGPTTFTTLLTQNTSYNGLGQPVTQTLVGAGSIQQMLQYEYDAAGRLICTAQRINPAYFAAPNTGACTLTLVAQGLGPDRIARSSYDNANRVTKLTQGYGSVSPADEWTLTYTNNGQTATLADANGNLTTYVYDGADRLSRIRFPNSAGGGSSNSDYEEYSYDAGSNLTLDRRRDASTISYTIDNLNRITQMAPSANGPTISYTYDNFGRRLTAAQSGHTLSFSYDQLSRNLTQQSSVLGTITYQYDLAGRRTRLTWPDAFYVTYAYDNANDLTGILENGTTSLAAYTYDNLGRVTLLTRGNGSTEAASFDNASNLASLTQDLPSSANDNSITLAYNAAAQITSRTGSNTAYQWSPIAPGTTNSTANGLNQYSAVGGASYTYDARGNLTSDGTNSYSYDIYNRLLTAPGSTALSYDPVGRLYEQSVSGAATRFLYDDDELIAEYNASGTLLRRTVPGAAFDLPVVWYEGAGTSDKRYLVQDERGSVIAVDASSGVSIYSYDEYGAPNTWSGPSTTPRFRYAGAIMLASAQLYSMRARVYAPSIGRFLQTDPILTEGGVNLYAYVGNDPVNAADPFGLASDDCQGKWCGETVFIDLCGQNSICGDEAREFLEQLRGSDIEPLPRVEIQELIDPTLQINDPNFCETSANSISEDNAVIGQLSSQIDRVERLIGFFGGRQAGDPAPRPGRSSAGDPGSEGGRFLLRLLYRDYLANLRSARDARSHHRQVLQERRAERGCTNSIL